MTAEGSKAPKAGAPEIEVTPAMIEAGVKAFYAYDSRFEAEEAGVARIYRAMCLAKDPR